MSAQQPTDAQTFSPWQQQVAQHGLSALAGDKLIDLRRQFFDFPTVAWIEAKADELGLKVNQQESLNLILDTWMLERANDKVVRESILPVIKAAQPNTLGRMDDDSLLALWRSCGEACTRHILNGLSIPRTPAMPQRITSEPLVPETMRAILEAHFGQGAIAALEGAGKLNLLASVDELPEMIKLEHAAQLPNIIGATHGDNDVYLIANRVDAKQVPGLFLHEVGEHAGLAPMLGADYGRLSAHFQRLLRRGDTYATWAAMRVPASTHPRNVPSEQLAYLVERVANDAVARPGGDDGYALGQECLSKLRTWLFRTPLCRWMDEVGALKDFTLSPADIASLAREAVDDFARRLDQEVEPSAPNQWTDRLDGKVLEDLYTATAADRARQLSAMPPEHLVGYLYSLAMTQAPAIGATIDHFAGTLAEMAAGLYGNELSMIAGDVLAQGRINEAQVDVRNQIARSGFALWMDNTSSTSEARLNLLSPSPDASKVWNLQQYRRDLGAINSEQYPSLEAALATVSPGSFLVPDSEAVHVLHQWSNPISAPQAQTDSLEFKHWFQGSRALNESGEPLVLYHGTGADFTVFDEGFAHWASATPDLANEYADYRGAYDKGTPAVMPVYMQARRPFDADQVARKDLTVASFFNEVARQAKLHRHAFAPEEARLLLNHIRACAKREESGPYYRTADFWSQPQLLFGRDGADSIKSLLKMLGFDSIRFTEQGQLTYGALDAAQIKSATGNVGTFNGAIRDMRFAFAGEKAGNASLELLEQARLLQRQGEDAEAIRQATGWFTGPDGKWRFEIDDSKAALRDQDAWYANGELNGHPVEKLSGNLFDELVTLNPVMAERLGYTQKLMPGLLDHPRLFQAYPELAGTRVEIHRSEGFAGASSGAYDPYKKLITINVNPALGGDPLSVLMHEVTHATQRIEGFARGGNVEMFDKAPPEDLAEQLREIIDLDELAKINNVTPLYFAQHSDYSADFVSRVEHWQQTDQWDSVVAMAIDRFVSPLEKYKRLAGEVEARNVQKRLGMTEAERLATAPQATADVPPEAIIIWSNGRETSLEALDSYEPKERRQQTETPEFKAWFDESVAVDEQGKPLVMYHGTDAEFSAFEDQAEGRTMGKSVGFYFTPDQTFAADYAEDGYVMPVYLSLKKPFRMEKFTSSSTLIEQFGDEVAQIQGLPDRAQSYFFLKDGGAYRGMETDRVGSQFKAILEKHGFDGVIFPEAMDALVDDRIVRRNVPVYTVFRPEQIKSAIGNVGTFNPATPDIRYSMRQADTAPAMRFVDEVTGAAHDQVDGTIGLQVNGTLVGILSYSVYQGDPKINMIEVATAFRRQGYGRELVMELQRQHPDTPIDFGMLSSEGALFYNALPKMEVETEFKGKLDELAQLTEERDAHIAAIKRYNDADAPDSELLAARDRAFDALNDLHDRISDLEGEIHGEPPHAVLIDTSKSALAAGETSGFKRWFGDSKIVDANGEPLVVYHGTNADIAAFDTALGGRNTRHAGAALGIYLTANDNLASSYADMAARNGSGGQNVVPLFVSIRNPKRYETAAAFYRDADKNAGREAEWRKELEGLGFDGVVVRDDFEEVIAFRPEQIKSAIGNNGDFNPTTPDIRFALAGEKAANAPLQALAEAKLMHEQGKDADAIWEATGWYRGIDGRWRFEIDDSKATFNADLLRSLESASQGSSYIKTVTYRRKDDGTYDLLLTPEHAKQPSDFVFLSGLSEHHLSAYIPAEVATSIRGSEGEESLMGNLGNLVEAREIPGGFPFDGLASLPLDEVIDHPALFTAYPKLRSVPVSVNPALHIGGSLALIDGEWRITIGKHSQEGSLIHEIQHLIQEVESFAKGGSERLVRGEIYPQLDARIERQSFVIERLVNERYEIARVIAGRLSDDDKQRLLQHPEAAELSDIYGKDSPDLWEDLSWHLDEYCGPDELESVGRDWYSELTAVNGRIKEACRIRDGYQAMMRRLMFEGAFAAYERLPGEIEARNASNRRQFTEDVRRSLRPEKTQDIASAEAFITWRDTTRPLFYNYETAPVDQTETPAFKEWFGASLVVDEDNHPQVMYHGSYRDFATFDRMASTRSRRVSMDTVGSWFSDNPGKGGAGMYAGGEGGAIYPVYLSIKRPKVYDTFQDFLRDMHSANGNRLEDMNPPGIGSPEALRERLKAQGYDGIAFIRSENQALHDERQELVEAINRAKDEYRSASADLRNLGLEMTRKDGAPYQAKIDRLNESLSRVDREIHQSGGSTEFDQQYVWIAFEPEQIKSAIGNMGAFDPTNPDIRFSFAGEKAVNAPLLALADAKLRHQQGEDAEAIRQKTGWFQGHDGKWRFEIDDSTASILPDTPLRCRAGAVPLDQVLDHPQLFTAYPELRTITVSLERRGPLASTASYDPEQRHILIEATSDSQQGLDAEQLSALLHESQHAIQEAEDFALGGSPQDKSLPTAHSILQKTNQHFAKLKEEVRQSVEYQAFIQARVAAFPADQRYRQGRNGLYDYALDVAENDAYDRFIQPIEDQRLAKIDRMLAQIAFFETSATSRRLAYTQLAGEVEARNVQARLGLSEAERAATAPAATEDTPADEIIVWRDIATPLAAAEPNVPGGESNKAAPESPANIRFAFAGEKAITAPRETLADAKLRHQQGEDAEAIRQKTGWHMGADGRWRFEIDDSDARLLPAFDQLSPERVVRIPTVLDHPQLFAAYPDMEYLNLIRVPDAKLNAEASFTYPYVYVKYSLTGDDALSAILHEMQHGIQKEEDFALGGSVGEPYRRVDPERLGEIEDATTLHFLATRTKGYQPNTLPELALERFKAITGRSPSMGSMTMAQFNTMENLKRQLNDARTNSAEPFDRYRRLAGEVEARNVQERRTLTQAERAAISPQATADVPPDRVLLRGDEGEASEQVLIVWNGEAVKTLEVPAPELRQTETAAFKEWFGASKILDALGEPLVCYHGTDADFSAFREGVAYFTPRQDYSYVENSDIVMPVYLAIRNPYRPATQQEIEQIRSNPERVAELEAQGFDGILWAKDGNLMRGASGWGDDLPQIVTFRPEQVKSAIGNNGAFSASNPDIRFSLAEPPKRLPVTERPAFQQWFRASKVVDGEGKPLKVYHGTAGDFSVFDKGMIGTAADDKRESTKAFWFSDQTQVAESFASLVGDGFVMPMYLRMENPLVVDCAEWARRYDTLHEGFRFSDQSTAYNIKYFKHNAIDQAHAGGHDGVIFKGGYDGIPVENAIIYAALEPSQMKSAIGNIGNFNRLHNDIRYRLNDGEEFSEPFKAWFGSSHIVDPSGKPLVMYHGTDREIEGGEFKRGPGMLGDAIYFSGNPTRASFFSRLAADRNGGNRFIVPVYLSLQNPLVFETPQDLPINKIDTDRLMALGYDGIIVKKGSASAPDTDQLFEVAVFRPQQVKSALSNAGTFSESADFRFRLDESPIPAAKVQEALEAELAQGKALDMSKEARLARAEAMGFDTKRIWYHGTEKAGFRSFNTDGQPSGNTKGTGAFFAANRGMARGYSGSSDDAVLLSGASLFHDPSQVDGLEIEQTWVIRNRYGRITAEASQRSYDTLEQWLADEGYELEAGERAEAAYYVHYDESNDFATEEETIAFLDELKIDQPGIYSVYLRAKDTLEIDWEGRNWDNGPCETVWNLRDEEGDVIETFYNREAAEEEQENHPGSEIEEDEHPIYESTNDAARQAREMGYDSVLIKDVADTGPHGQYDDGNVMVVFDASNIRSVDAVFDPAHSASDKLLFSLNSAPQSVEFDQWFAGSHVVDGEGKPLLVYRGEHGAQDQAAEAVFQSRLGSLSFGDFDTAHLYATSPNNFNDVPVAPRITPAYLSIKAPLVVGDDPYLDFPVLIDAIGFERAKQIAIDLEDAVIDTKAWLDLGTDLGTDLGVEEYLAQHPEALSSLYVPTYLVLDKHEYVEWLKQAGFDGAIYGGSGDSSEKPEYRVFSPSQVLSGAPMPALTSHANHIVGAIPFAEPLRLHSSFEGAPTKGRKFAEENHAERTMHHGHGLYLSGRALAKKADSLGLLAQNTFRGEPLTIARIKKLVSAQDTPAALQEFLNAAKRPLLDGENVEVVLRDHMRQRQGQIAALEGHIAAVMRGEHRPLSAHAYNLQLRGAKAELGWLIGHMQEFGRTQRQEPDLSAFLQWDAPITEQPQPVREALALIGIDGHFEVSAGRQRESFLSRAEAETRLAQMADTGTPAKVHDASAAMHPIPTGGQLYRELASIVGSEEAVSKLLASSGIPGIRYRPGDTRSSEASSFVLFKSGERSVSQPYGVMPLTRQSGNDHKDELQTIADIPGVLLHGSVDQVRPAMVATAKSVVASARAKVEALEERANWLRDLPGVSPELVEKNKAALAESRQAQKHYQAWKSPSVHNCLPWDRVVPDGLVSRIQSVISIKPEDKLTGSAVFNLVASRLGGNAKACQALSKAGVLGVYSDSKTLLWDRGSAELAAKVSETLDQSARFHLAYHGTPHTVDRFSTENIGSGDGAQVFGWGLYFAQLKMVASHYQQINTRDAVWYDDQLFTHPNDMIDALVPPVVAKHPELVSTDSRHDLENALCHLITVKCLSGYRLSDVMERYPEPILQVAKPILDGIRPVAAAEIDGFFVMPNGGARTLNAVEAMDEADLRLGRHEVEAGLKWIMRPDMSDTEMADTFARYLQAITEPAVYTPQREELLEELAKRPSDEYLQARLRDCDHAIRMAENARRYAEECGPLRVCRPLGNGNMYLVDINIRNDEYLDHGKPFDQQSALVQNALHNLIESDQLSVATSSTLCERIINNATGAELYTCLSEGKGVSTPEEYVQAIRAASMALLSEGVQGIRYQDGLSRSAGKETTNYVVFDDSRIQILGGTNKVVKTEEDEIPLYQTTTSRAGRGASTSRMGL